MAEVALRVNGSVYAGWESVRVTRGIESLCGGFELAVSDRWANRDQSWPILEEDECTVTIGRETLISGYVDKRSISYGPNEHTLRVSGRDKAGALVDCSAVLKDWEFEATPLLSLAQKLAAPFGIKVSMSADLAQAVTLSTSSKGGTASGAGGAGKIGLPAAPGKSTIDPGESVFEVLDRACRLAGVLPVSDGNGGIVLTRAGSARAVTALVEGVNILEASADYDASSRYRSYIILGQTEGSDDSSGAAVAAVTAEAQDLTVRRSERVLCVRPEASVTPEAAKTRAQWEANVRAARGDTVSVTVQGWTQGDGSLWPVNALVHLNSPKLGMRARLLITETTFELDASRGQTTKLALKRPDAFIPAPVEQPAGAWKELVKGA